MSHGWRKRPEPSRPNPNTNQRELVAGINEKADVTLRFLKAKATEFETLKHEIQTLKNEIELQNHLNRMTHQEFV